MEMSAHFEPLGKNISIEVSRDYRFGEDALYLAAFAAPRETDSVCDLGTGCGILPLLWCRNYPLIKIEAFEIQKDAAAMAERSVERNGFSANVHIHNADLRQWKEILPPNSQDIVTMNPPYFAAQSGAVSQSEAAQIARHEGVGCTLTEIAAAAKGLLKTGGRFCLCHRPERLCDVLQTLRAAQLEPKRLQFVQKSIDTAPWLLLCEARKDSNPGLSVLPPICKK